MYLSAGLSSRSMIYVLGVLLYLQTAWVMLYLQVATTVAVSSSSASSSRSGKKRQGLHRHLQAGAGLLRREPELQNWYDLQDLTFQSDTGWHESEDAHPPREDEPLRNTGASERLSESSGTRELMSELQYGMRVVLTRLDEGNQYFGYEANDSALGFSLDSDRAQSLFLRPPVTKPTGIGCLRWNSQIVLSKSADAESTAECGWYGCKVATIAESGRLILSHGRDFPTAFWVRHPPEVSAIVDDSSCVHAGDSVVLAQSREERFVDGIGWYGNSVAFFDSAGLGLNFGAGGEHPHLFALGTAHGRTSSPHQAIADVDLCEALGVLEQSYTWTGEYMGLNISRESCSDLCTLRLALFFSFRSENDGSGQCRCGTKGESFAWLLAQATSSSNPWFVKPEPCQGSEHWCTSRTSCKRCMLARRAFAASRPHRYDVGSCIAKQPSLDCVSTLEGSWIEVDESQCSDACKLQSYDGMDIAVQKDFAIGHCRPLYSLNTSRCEDWTSGRWTRVPKADCESVGSWRSVGHFEDSATLVGETADFQVGDLTWKVLGEAGLHKSKHGETFHPLSWVQLQQSCKDSKLPTSDSQGSLQTTLSTKPHAHYSLIFQAAFEHDWDRSGVSRGQLTINGLKTEFSTTSLFDGDSSHEWSMIEVPFTAKSSQTDVKFSAPPDQCIMIREVILSRQQSLDEAGVAWQDSDVLQHTFRRTGCPTRADPRKDEVLANAFATWRKQGEEGALRKMWWTCEKARLGIESQQRLCCGSEECPPARCSPQLAIRREWALWGQWVDTKSLIGGQRVSEHDSEDRILTGAAASNLQVAFSSFACSAESWWQVSLGSLKDIKAVRLNSCKHCMSDQEIPIKVLVGGITCIEGVILSVGQSKEVPCFAKGHNIRVETIGGQPISLCDVEILEGGRLHPSVAGYCPFELQEFHFRGSGDLETGHLQKDEFFETRQIFKRPVTVTAELRADSPGCLSAILFPIDDLPGTGYAIQTGAASKYAMASHIDSLFEMGPNDRWTKISIHAKDHHNVSYSVNGKHAFDLNDGRLFEGRLRFEAGCVGGRVRNVHVWEQERCAVQHRTCSMFLNLDHGREHWEGSGNAALLSLSRGQFLQSKALLARPLRVRAEVWPETAGSTTNCSVALQVLTGDARLKGGNQGYTFRIGSSLAETERGSGTYLHRFEGERLERSPWYDLEIEANLKGQVSYYMNGQLVKQMVDTSRGIGKIALLNGCPGMVARNVQVTMIASCHRPAAHR